MIEKDLEKTTKMTGQYLRVNACLVNKDLRKNTTGRLQAQNQESMSIMEEAGEEGERSTVGNDNSSNGEAAGHAPKSQLLKMKAQ